MAKRDLSIGIDGDPKGFDQAAKRAEESAKAFDRELGKVERELAMTEQRTKATTNAIKTYGREQDKTALAARKLGIAAKEAGDKAERAQRQAADAAEALANGEGDAAHAAELAARAETAVEHAAIKAAEAHRAAARAADEQAQQERQLARDAALAAAAERLGALKASGAVKEHNALIRQLEARFGDLSKEGAGAFKMIEQTGTTAFSFIGSSGPIAIVAIAVALAALPFIASVAAGGIALAFGGALAAIAIKSQLANADVQAAFAGTSKYVSAGVKNISAPFHSTLLSIAADGRTAFDNLKGSLSGAFAVMAPAVTRFSGQFASSLSELNPAITSIGRAFSAVLGSLGSAMPTIMHNLGAAIKSITDAAAANPQALTSLVVDISQIAQAAGTAIATMIRYKDVIGGTLGLITGKAGSLPQIWRGIKGTSESFREVGGQAAAAGGHLSALDKDMQTLASTTATATEKANALTDAFNRLLNPAEAVFTDTAKLKDGIGALSKALDKSHGSLNDNTAASRAAKHAFTGVLDGAKSLASDMLNSGKSIDQVRAALNPYIHSMYEAAGSNKEARALVDAFVQSLGQVPPKKGTTLTLEDRDFLAKLHTAQGLELDPKTGYLRGDNADYFNKWLKANHLKIDPKTGLFRGDNADYFNKWLAANHLKIDPKTGVIKGNTKSFWDSVHAIPPTVGYRKIGVYYVPLNSANEPGKTRPQAHGGLIHRAKGGPVRLADGGPSGMVRGPGTTTSDSIPTLLSNKEFVVNAEDTAKNLPLLEAINAGRQVAASMIAPRPVSAGGARGGDGASITVVPPDVHVIVDGHEIFTVVQEKGREYTTRNLGRSPFATSAGG